MDANSDREQYLQLRRALPPVENGPLAFGTKARSPSYALLGCGLAAEPTPHSRIVAHHFFEQEAISEMFRLFGDGEEHEAIITGTKVRNLGHAMCITLLSTQTGCSWV